MTRPLVTHELISKAKADITKLGARPAMVKMEETEPFLVEHVSEGMDLIWEKLTSYGIVNVGGPHIIDGALFPLILGVMVSALEATRAAYGDAKPEADQQVRRPSHDRADGMFQRPIPLVTGKVLSKVASELRPLSRNELMLPLKAKEPELYEWIVTGTRSALDVLDTYGYIFPQNFYDMFADHYLLIATVAAEAASRAAKGRR